MEIHVYLHMFKSASLLTHTLLLWVSLNGKNRFFVLLYLR